MNEQTWLDTGESIVVVRPMLTINRAIDLFVGDLTRRGYSDRTRTTYSRILDKFADRAPVDIDVARITADDCRRFLDLYNRKAAGTRAHTYAVLSSFFSWLVVTEQIKRSPLATIARPKRQRPDDLDVVTISRDDVRKLLAGGHTWTEKLAVAIPVYIGPRRKAVAQLRLSDYDTGRRRMRFREKGGKTIWKPVPDELANLIGAAIADGAIREPDDYLVPPEGHLSRSGARDDRVIWRVVKRVADRVGVETHVHALRAAFAVYYLERHPGDTHGLKELLGHQSYETTQVYLRKLDTTAAMERVRDLSWADEAEGEDGWGDVLEELTSFVYFITAGDITVDGTPVKIGVATDPTERLADLQVGHHEQLALATTVPGGRTLEQQLHSVLADSRIRGEWFRATARLRDLVDALETRMAAGKGAHLGAESFSVMGAGGFEPPFGEAPSPERRSSPSRAVGPVPPKLDELRRGQAKEAER